MESLGAAATCGRALSTGADVDESRRDVGESGTEDARAGNDPAAPATNTKTESDRAEKPHPNLRCAPWKERSDDCIRRTSIGAIVVPHGGMYLSTTIVPVKRPGRSATFGQWHHR